MKKIKIEIDLADVFELETEDSDSSVIETSLNKIKQKIVREAIYDEARSIYRTEILQYKETKDIQKEIDNFFTNINDIHFTNGIGLHTDIHSRNEIGLH